MVYCDRRVIRVDLHPTVSQLELAYCQLAVPVSLFLILYSATTEHSSLFCLFILNVISLVLRKYTHVLWVFNCRIWAPQIDHCTVLVNVFVLSEEILSTLNCACSTYTQGNEHEESLQFTKQWFDCAFHFWGTLWSVSKNIVHDTQYLKVKIWLPRKSIVALQTFHHHHHSPFPATLLPKMQVVF